MITVFVNGSEKVLCESLKIEAQKEEKKYVFKTKERAIETISRLSFYYLKEKEINELLKTYNIEDKDMILMHVSEKMMEEVRECITLEVKGYLKNNDFIDLIGFSQFRLRKEKEIIKQELNKACNLYVNQEDINGPEYFRMIMDNQVPLENKIKLIVENKKIKVTGETQLYFEENLGENDYEAEDEALSHIIVIKPNVLEVYDPENALSKQTVYLLNEIFKEKIRFS